jgi:hypothetical protein
MGSAAHRGQQDSHHRHPAAPRRGQHPRVRLVDAAAADHQAAEVAAAAVLELDGLADRCDRLAARAEEAAGAAPEVDHFPSCDRHYRQFCGKRLTHGADGAA